MDITEEGCHFSTEREMEMSTKGFSEQDSNQRYEVLQELGDCYCSVGKWVAAQNCYEKAASLGPDEPGPYIGLGVVGLQMGHLDDAEIAFRVACRLGRACARGYSGLGMVAQARGDYKHAFEMYLKCLEIDSDNLTAILGLFQTSCQMGSFATIIHYLEVYLNMHPGDISVMFTLAALYMKERRFEASKKILLDILTLDGSHRDSENLLEEVEHNLAQARQAGVQAG